MIVNQHSESRNHHQQTDSKTKLELFKTLLQPHFLFNSLNNLYALSLHRSDQIPQAIAGLSQLLERVVLFSRKDQILLSEEIGLIEDYIALEKTWLGEASFMMDFHVKGDTDGVSIPPLTIYTLIENAFKHGIRKCENNGWITIHMVVKENRILLKIRNSVQPCSNSADLAPGSHTGLGIEAVHKLLENSFRKQYSLDARPIGNVFAVDLIISRVSA